MTPEELELLERTTSPVGREAIVRAVYHAEKPRGAVLGGLRNKHLVNATGEPTILGRDFADHLIKQERKTR